MKQHITVEQLNELSEKGKERLREWWYKRAADGDLIAGCPHTSRHEFGLCLEENIWYQDSEWGYPSGWYLPLLSIGQILEFLDEHTEMPEYDFYKTDKWYVYLDGGKDLYDSKYFGEELCDALWEAVKEVLEKEDK